MSWDEIQRYDYPCKCGKGTITYVSEMDDWNRSRSHEIINCPECAAEARATATAKAKAEQEARDRLKELASEIKRDFEERYIEQWITLFAAVRNKKQAWELAKEIGLENRSLNSFYDFNKGSSIADYVLRLARPYNMDKIIEILEIDDDDFKNKVDEAIKLSSYDRSILLN